MSRITSISGTSVLITADNCYVSPMVWDAGLRALGPGVLAYKLMEVVVLYHHTRLHTPGYSAMIPRRTNTFLCFTPILPLTQNIYSLL